MLASSLPPSPWSGPRMLGRGTGSAYPPVHRRLPPSRRGLPQLDGHVPPEGRAADADIDRNGPHMAAQNSDELALSTPRAERDRLS